MLKLRERINEVVAEDEEVSEPHGDVSEPSYGKFLEGVFPSRRQRSDESREVTEITGSYDPYINKCRTIHLWNVTMSLIIHLTPDH